MVSKYVGALNVKWDQLEDAIKTIAEKTVGHNPRRLMKRWFGKDCQQATDKENTA